MEDEREEQEHQDEGDTMAAVVESLKAQIAERDKRIQEAENKVKDREKTIRLLLDGENQERAQKEQGDMAADFRKRCKF